MGDVRQRVEQPGLTWPDVIGPLLPTWTITTSGSRPAACRSLEDLERRRSSAGRSPRRPRPDPSASPELPRRLRASRRVADRDRPSRSTAVPSTGVGREPWGWRWPGGPLVRLHGSACAIGGDVGSAVASARQAGPSAATVARGFPRIAASRPATDVGAAGRVASGLRRSWRSQCRRMPEVRGRRVHAGVRVGSAPGASAGAVSSASAPTEGSAAADASAGVSAQHPRRALAPMSDRKSTRGALDDRGATPRPGRRRAAPRAHDR